VPVSISTAALHDTRGEPIGALALVEDITDRKRAEQEMARLYEEAQQAARAKDEFLATLSHELRTPLNALMGWIWQLRNTALDERARQRALESLERNTRVQAQLINDLLDISRISKGKIELAHEPVDLHAVVMDSVDVVREAADAKRLTIAIASEPGCLVFGDRARLQQVVTNLLTNAVQFTPERGRIDIGVAAADGKVTLEVHDTGAGIDPAFLPHVFDQFRQGESVLSRRHGGLGLGLSVVRQLVELHGGRVEVSSQGAGSGSTFTLTLPTST
jgi:signal transduction histidine kinase